MSKHTPPPWAVDPDHRPGMEWNAHVVEAADPNNRVCFMTSEGKINADFIVKAVNNHERLIEALEFIRDGYENHNINRVDYRVKVYQVALDALGSVPEAK